MRSVYIHIPFCNNICSYCDFIKMVAKEDTKDRYIHTLIKELHLYKEHYSNVSTIYIGGGTPSSLRDEHLEMLLKEINNIFNMDNIVEFSIECNPESLSLSKINLLKEYYVNRVSLGVQTFNEEHLELLRRSHSYKDVVQAITNLRGVGIDNINIDLMFAIPGQTLESIKDDINIVRTLDIEHISYYSLILEEGTLFSHLLDKHKLELVDNIEEASMYEYVIKELKSIGYKHYEISNFTKGIESTHNKTYWENLEYVGLGLGAHGYLDGVRYSNTSDLKEYIDGEFIEDKNTLSIEDKMSEELILGLRLIEGISLVKFKNRYNKDMLEVFSVIEKQIKLGNLEIIDNHLRLTEKGLLIGNDIFELFLTEEE